MQWMEEYNIDILLLQGTCEQQCNGTKGNTHNWHFSSYNNLQSRGFRGAGIVIHKIMKAHINIIEPTTSNITNMRINAAV